MSLERESELRHPGTYRPRFFTAEDERIDNGLLLDTATSSAMATSIGVPPSSSIYNTSRNTVPGPVPNRKASFFDGRRRGSIKGHHPTTGPTHTSTIIRLESLGSTGAKLICFLQLAAFIISLTLILSHALSSSRAILLTNIHTSTEECGREYMPITEYYDEGTPLPTTEADTEAIATSCTTFTPLTPTTPSVTTTTHTITSLGTVIGTIYLHLQFPNGTTYAANTELNEDGEPVFDYDVIVTGCPYTPATACGSGDWLEVLTMGTKGDGGPVRTVVRSPFDDGYHDDSVAEAKIFAVYQNQENIINQGWVNSYTITTSIYNATNLTNPATSQFYYEFQYSDLSPRYFEKETRVIFFFLNVGSLLYWLVRNYRYNDYKVSFSEWMPEKKWMTAMIVGTCMYQNPLLIVVQYIESPLIELSFFTKVIQILSYTILATAFLLFSDGISRTTKSRRAFYLPKIALMTVYFALSVAFELLNVPSMVGIDRSPILATYNWSKPLKHLNFGIGVALLIVSCWIGVYFFTNVYNTQKVLDELPYLEYRYQHLSYRFFILHSTSLLFFSFCSYITILFGVGKDLYYSSAVTSLTFIEEFNGLLRTTTGSFGQQLFLVVYTQILAYMYQPPSRKTDKSLAHAMLLTQYFRFEEPMQQKIFNYVNLETAAWLLEAAWASYYDKNNAESPTRSGWGQLEVSQHNWEVIGEVHNLENEAHCLILKDLRRNRIVVAFRGTSSSAHWTTNLKYNMANYDLESGDLPSGVQNLLLTAGQDEMDNFEEMEAAVFRSEVDTETDLGADDLASSLLMSKRVFSGEVEDHTMEDKSRKMMDRGMDFVRETKGAMERAVLKQLGGGIHSGFLEAYLSIRNQIALEVAKHLLKNPSDVYFTGHSMGGALAHIAMYDFTSTIIPHLNGHIENIWASQIALEGPDWIDRMQGRLKRKMKTCCYTFGAPRCFSTIITRRLNEKCPAIFRFTVDGDIVPSFPKFVGGGCSMKYKHNRNAVVIDGYGRGMVIVNPSFVERRFHLARRNQMKMHGLQAYRKGIWGAIGEEEAEKKRAMGNGGLCGEEILAFLEKGEEDEEGVSPPTGGGGDRFGVTEEEDGMEYSDALERASTSSFV